MFSFAIQTVYSEQYIGGVITGSIVDCSLCSTMLPIAGPDLYCHGNFPDLSPRGVLHLSASRNYTMESLHPYFTPSWHTPHGTSTHANGVRELFTH